MAKKNTGNFMKTGGTVLQMGAGGYVGMKVTNLVENALLRNSPRMATWSPVIVTAGSIAGVIYSKPDSIMSNMALGAGTVATTELFANIEEMIRNRGANAGMPDPGAGDDAPAVDGGNYFRRGIPGVENIRLGKSDVDWPVLGMWN